MDRVPPWNAVAWGPDGPVGKNLLNAVMMDALRNIEKSKKYLERKEKDVEDAKENIVSLKAYVFFVCCNCSEFELNTCIECIKLGT